MPDEKVKYPFEHLVAMEKEAFFIQVDNTVFTVKGEYFFDKDSVDHLGKTIMSGFREQIKKGTEKQKQSVYKALLNFNIFPLRFH